MSDHRAVAALARKYKAKLKKASQEIVVAGIYMDDGAAFSAAAALERAAILLREAGELHNTAMRLL